MRRMKFVWLAIAVAGLTLGLAACGGDDDDGGPGETSLDLTIGDSVPLSGALAVFGPGRQGRPDRIQRDQRCDQAGRCGPQRHPRHGGQRDPPQPAVQAARKMVGRRGRRELHRRRVGICGHDPDLRVGHVPRGRAADLARLDQQRGRYAR